MALVETLFSEYPDGAPADWSDYWSTGDFTATVETNAAGDIDFGTKWLKFETDATDKNILTWDDLGSMSDVCVVTKVRVIALQTTGVRIFLRVSGSAASENAYYLAVRSGQLQVAKFVNGTFASLATKGFAPIAGYELWVKFQVIGTAIKAKVWNADCIEPYDWTIETTASDLASGAVGVGSYDNATDFAIDYFGADSSEINMPVAYEDDVRFSISRMGVGNNISYNYGRAMGGYFTASDRKLKGAGIYCHATHADQVRIAVYSGGALATGPQGATLLKDFGLTSGVAVDQWIDITTVDDIDIPVDAPLWVVIKGDSGAGLKTTYTSDVACHGDFQVARGRLDVVSIIGQDPDVAFPAIFPAGSAGSGNFWFAFRLLTEADTGIDETSKLVNLTLTVSDSDGLTQNEHNRSIAILATVSVTDIQTYVDASLLISISGSVSETDLQTYVDKKLLVVILVTTSVSEFEGFDELSRLINLNLAIFETDTQAYKDLLMSIPMSLTPSVSDVQTYIDTSLAISMTFGISVFDSIPYNDTDLLINITSAVSVTDNQGYSEILNILLSIGVTRTDIQAYIDDMLILMGMSVELSDTVYEQMLIELAMSLIAIDGYATDTTRQAYELISRKKSFELIGRIKTYYLEKG